MLSLKLFTSVYYFVLCFHVFRVILKHFAAPHHDIWIFVGFITASLNCWFLSDAIWLRNFPLRHLIVQVCQHVLGSRSQIMLISQCCRCSLIMLYFTIFYVILSSVFYGFQVISLLCCVVSWYLDFGWLHRPYNFWNLSQLSVLSHHVWRGNFQVVNPINFIAVLFWFTSLVQSILPHPWPNLSNTVVQYFVSRSLDDTISLWKQSSRLVLKWV